MRENEWTSLGSALLQCFDGEARPAVTLDGQKLEIDSHLDLQVVTHDYDAAAKRQVLVYQPAGVPVVFRVIDGKAALSAFYGGHHFVMPLHPSMRFRRRKGGLLDDVGFRRGLPRPAQVLALGALYPDGSGDQVSTWHQRIFDDGRWCCLVVRMWAKDGQVNFLGARWPHARWRLDAEYRPCRPDDLSPVPWRELEPSTEEATRP